MAVSSGTNILARARVLASQIGIDPNQSTIIDNKGGIRALLNNAIRETYRGKADDQKFIRDIVTRQTVAVTDGVGACPDEVMREFLEQAEFADDNNSLITYYNYNIDANSTVNYQQLGYVVMQGDNFMYTAPAPDFDTYSGNLFVTVPCFPTFPASMADPITFASSATLDDVCLSLAYAIRGDIKLGLTGAMAA